MNRAGWRYPLALAALWCMGSLGLTGCWDRTEVNDLALITGAAIDRDEAGRLELTVQIFIPRASGGGGGAEPMSQKNGSTGNNNTFTRTAVGENIADAFSHLQGELSRALFWGHAEVIVFGEAAAKSGIRDHIDYLLRAPQPRERAFVYVSKGKAQDVLQLHSILERDTAEVLREMSKSKLALSVTLAELAAMLTDDAHSAVLPMLTIVPAPTFKQMDQALSFIDGLAVFKDDRMIGGTDSNAARGVLWLRNEIKRGIVTVHPVGPGSSVSLKLLKSSTRLIPRIEGDTWRMDVYIRTENDALQNTTRLNLTSNLQAMKQVEAEMNEEMKSQIRQALVAVQEGMKVDIFDFAGEFHRAYPVAWKKEKSRWDERFPNVEVRLHPNAKMLRPGLASIRSTVPDKEYAK
ncbi:Ger(x)C family spore germination protein [Cohnella nanjingensis]|uniref:Ger(X)C family spore germination protein n=1 Tax=Cohnella nanjingensis TaxID=1387779 RepID=A0A7X0RS94_9BACL|nr:Ger(x)C family spore germination protein [Cohnella nanjingensis]MBB6671551.1 Ger(x)C family spore germination protein [Cohnella nanjingensis]